MIKIQQNFSIIFFRYETPILILCNDLTPQPPLLRGEGELPSL